MRKLLKMYQVVLVSKLPNKKFMQLARIFDDNQIIFDAIYADTRANWLNVQDYSQIIKDFCTTISNTLILSSFNFDPQCFTKENSLSQIINNTSEIPIFSEHECEFDINPVCLLMPNLQWNHKNACITFDQIYNTINDLCGNNKSHSEANNMKLKIMRRNTATRCDWQAGFEKLKQNADFNKLIFITETNKFTENILIKNEFENNLYEHYNEMLEKRASKIYKKYTDKYDFDEKQQSVKSGLFVAFRKTTMGVFDCFQIASHNADLIKTAFCEISKAASNPTIMKDSIKDTKQLIKYWKSFIDAYKTHKLSENRLLNKIVLILKSDNTKNNCENEKILTEPFGLPYLNIEDVFGRKKSAVPTSSRKNSFDPKGMNNEKSIEAANNNMQLFLRKK